MKIQIKESGTGHGAGAPRLEDVTPQEIADLWVKGASISAPSQLQAHPAQFVVTGVNLAGASPSTYLDHHFTRVHATVVAANANYLFLLFELPASVSDDRCYKLLQMGLAALYFKAFPVAAIDQPYGGQPNLSATVPGMRLTAGAINFLYAAGRDQHQIRRTKGEYCRSQISVAPEDVYESATGHGLRLDHLPDGQLVYCPFHIDSNPTAEAVTLKEGRGLVCHGCRRAFGPESKVNAYDFSRFDSALAGLRESAGSDERNQFTFLTERYLPPGLVEGEGIWCIKSPKGSGKTELLSEVIASARSAGQRVALFGHRRTLLQSMTHRLGIDCYLAQDDSQAAKVATPKPNLSLLMMDEPQAIEVEAPGNALGTVRVDPTGYYGVCLDSLPKLKTEKDKYDVILIDECEQVFAHLVGTTLRDQRRTVFLMLEHYLRVAKTVVLLDADLGMITMKSLFAMNLMPETRFHFVLNRSASSTGEVLMYEDAGQLVEVMKRSVREGKKVFIAVNAKTKAIELEQMLAKENPGKRVQAIHADNAQRPEIQAMLKNLAHEFEQGLDVLVGSPALGTGVDISFYDEAGNAKVVVDRVFGLFRNNITTHFEVDQHLFRVRHPGQVHVWVDKSEMNYEADAAAIRAELMHTIAKEVSLLGFKDDGSPILKDEDGLMDIWSEVKAVQRGSKNVFKSAFQQLRRSNACTVVSVAADEGANAVGKKALLEARLARIELRAQAIERAVDLEEHEQTRLRKRVDDGLPITSEEQCALDKATLKGFYHVDVDAALVKFDADGQTRRSVRNLELMLGDPADIVRWAFDELKADAVARTHRQKDGKRSAGMPAFDMSMSTSRREVLRSLLSAAGVFDATGNRFITAAQLTHGRLDSFMRKVADDRRRLQTLFDLALRSDFEQKRIMQLGAILGLVGLSTVAAGTADKKGQKVRSYQLDAEKLDPLLSTVDRRIKARLAKVAGEAVDRAEANSFSKDFQAKMKLMRAGAA
jgi:hypothetical protein